MKALSLSDFIDTNRDELIGRCRAKVAGRSGPPATEAELGHGVPMFLEQLCEELVNGPSETHEITKSAKENGHDHLLREFTISQVVHGYGDVCQSVTDLAVELAAPIATDDFRTMNRCLDDAIAGAVTQYAEEQQRNLDGTTSELRRLTDAAIAAFEILQDGKVGFGGSTAAVVRRSLELIRSLADKQHTALAPKADSTATD
jgi:hypothetical protein